MEHGIPYHFKMKCILCQRDNPRSRDNLLTCTKNCSKIYTRLSRYIRGKITSKHIIENKKLKKKIELLKINNAKLRGKK